MSGGPVPIQLILNANPEYLRSDLGDLGPLQTDIKRRGQQAPIIVDHSYLILDGARRVEVAKRLGRTEILTIATKDFEYIKDLFVEAVARHEKGEIHLPKSYLDYMELIPILRPMYRPVSHARGVATRKAGEVGKSDGEYRQTGVMAHLAEMFGVTIAVVEQLSRAANILQQARTSRRPGALERVLRAISELQEANTPFPLPVRMREAMQDPKPPPITNAVVLREQQGRLRRMFAALEGSIIALPGEDDLDPGHSPEDLESWFKQAGDHATALRQFRSTLKLRLDQLREESSS